MPKRKTPEALAAHAAEMRKYRSENKRFEGREIDRAVTLSVMAEMARVAAVDPDAASALILRIRAGAIEVMGGSPEAEHALGVRLNNLLAAKRDQKA